MPCASAALRQLRFQGVPLLLQLGDFRKLLPHVLDHVFL